MSHVTNIVLLCSAADELAAVAFGDWIGREHHGVDLARVDDEAVGPKAMEQRVYVAALNGCHVPGIKREFRRTEWQDPDNALLVITEQGENPVAVKVSPWD